MFGIGFGELVIIAIVLLIAVGPNKMPTLAKAIGKGVRQFRRATRELRNSTGIDELMRDEDLADLRNPLAGLMRSDESGLAGVPARVVSGRRADLSAEDRAREYPPEGVDIHLGASGPNDDGDAGEGRP